VTLVCVSCWNWYRRCFVKELEPRPVCGSCQSTSLGVLTVEPEEVMNLLARRGKPSNRKERGYRSQAVKTAMLVERYGKAAVFTLASKYLSAQDASEVLAQESGLGSKLVELIVERERKKIQEMFR
ncbi:MAG: hypothetical protein QXL42_05455, partial [Candidatus Caldarchaeum sp.]